MQDIADDIIRKAAAGDMQAFEAIYQATSAFVYNVALRVTGNREDAEDVTQEVFLTMHHKLGEFRFQSSLKTWAYRITVNAAINASKKRSRGATVAIDDVPFEGAVESAVHAAADREANEGLVNALLDSLNEDQRACVTLRSIEGLSYEDIARVLGVNINTVRTRLKRAREKMMEMRKKVGHGLH